MNELNKAVSVKQLQDLHALFDRRLQVLEAGDFDAQRIRELTAAVHRTADLLEKPQTRTAEVDTPRGRVKLTVVTTRS